MDGQLVVNADGTISLGVGEWWCQQCGRVAALDEWDRCDPCAITDRDEAQRIADIIGTALAGMTAGQRASTLAAVGAAVLR